MPRQTRDKNFHLVREYQDEEGNASQRTPLVGAFLRAFKFFGNKEQYQQKKDPEEIVTLDVRELGPEMIARLAILGLSVKMSSRIANIDNRDEAVTELNEGWERLKNNEWREYAAGPQGYPVIVQDVAAALSAESGAQVSLEQVSVALEAQKEKMTEEEFAEYMAKWEGQPSIRKAKAERLRKAAEARAAAQAKKAEAADQEESDATAELFSGLGITTEQPESAQEQAQ